MFHKIIEEMQKELDEKYQLLSENSKNFIASVLYDGGYLKDGKIETLNEHIKYMVDSENTNIFTQFSKMFLALENTALRVTIGVKNQKQIKEYREIHKAYINLFKIRACQHNKNFKINDEVVETLDIVGDKEVFVWCDEIYIGSKYPNQAMVYGSEMLISFIYGLDNEPAYIIGNVSK